MSTSITSSVRSLKICTLLFCIVINSIASVFLQSVDAAYVETNTDSFVGYKRTIEGALQDFEREFRVNNTVSDSTLNNLRSLVQESYSRLPDSGEAASKNESLKKSADLYIDLALKNKSSSMHASNAASNISRFLSEASISQIAGSISANPSSGNAPMTSSFLATAKDPSGINIPDSNFIWWMREAGGYRRELGRGPSLTYTFSKEGNYQVFLDVNSESRNKKGKTDVTPLTISQDIEVKPRLGNVILLINGVNVSNLDTLKVSPTLGKIGLLFDATASRAVSNGVITKTKWDFGNGNTYEYDGAPILEKQLYVNPEMYKVVLEITTNQGQTFRKQIQLLIRDPAAVISLDKEVGFINEAISMSAKSYLANTNNVEYNWEIQDVTSEKKVITSKVGSTFTYKFAKVGQYLITLTSRNPNGQTDSDSRVISIESRPPIINLDSTKPISTEKPNTFIFDASRSFDPDTNNSKGLSYTWMIDGTKVNLNDIQKEGAIGSYTFSEKGNHTVSLTVANPYGKVNTIDKSFEVSSTLTVGINISPRATAIGSIVGFQAKSPQARFYEWDLGDGSPTINGTSDFVQHIYKKTGIYTVTLGVKNGDGSQENRISRKVYITDTDKPYALIDVRNGLGMAPEDPTACENPDGAFAINRADNTTIDANNSINVDGNASGLSYTWKYMDRVKTGPSLSEKFTELGCFPIQLTVKSEKTGASHTATRYVQIKNISPKVTSVDASVDATKKSTQKLLVNVVANGARDDDGVITSYIWFYTTESDSEKQNVRITQTPSTTFVLPNVTEKYYFSVIVEDNDGARYDTSEGRNDLKPLIIANDDGNVNMPLISLNLDKSQILTNETIQYSVTAKNILGTDITNKSEYYWDFDGDGKIDQKGAQPQASYTYKNAGKYNMKVKVVSNGVSNTKYQIVYVKNELKASVAGYKIGPKTYFLNTSRGNYDSVTWNIGGFEDGTPYGTSVNNALIGSSGSTIGSLMVKYGLNEVSSVDIRSEDIVDVPNNNSGILVQSFPAMNNDEIRVASPGDKVIISMYGNAGKEYVIDSDIKIDSDIDSVPDNDIDNKNTPSFDEGSPYLLSNFENIKVPSRTIKASIRGTNGQIIASKDIKLVFDFIKAAPEEGTTDISGTGSFGFSTVDKENLAKLQSKIKSLNPEDRIIFTQYYNNLIENWSDLTDRTEGLILIQREVTASTSIDDATKIELSDIIDLTLIGDAQSVNEISIASRVIEGLISNDNVNRAYIVERLEKIKSNPGNLTENKLLGKEILEKVQADTSISNENKLLIKSQLLTIVNGGQESVPEEEKSALSESTSTGSGILGFIGGAVKIFLLIIAIVLFLFFLGYIAYRFSKKSGDMGFQDFLIDSIAHSKSETKESVIPISVSDDSKTLIIENPILEKVVEKESVIRDIIDPLATVMKHKDSPTDPLSISEVVTHENPIPETAAEEAPKSAEPEEIHNIPDWLKPLPQVSDTPEVKTTWKSKDDSESILIKKEEKKIIVNSNTTDIEIRKIDDTPSLLTPPIGVIPESMIEHNTDSDEAEVDNTEVHPLPEENVTEAKAEDTEEHMIPDWLVSNPTTQEEVVEVTPESVEKIETPVIPSPDAELPDWLKNSFEPTESSISDTDEEITPIKKPKTPKTAGVKTKKKISDGAPKKSSSSSNDDIPDWLK